MKRGIIWILLTCLMLTSLVLASCTTKTTSSSTTSTTSTTKTTTTKTTTTTSTTKPPTTTTTTNTTTTGNWWDSLGTPQYGGILTIREQADIASWEPSGPTGVVSIINAWTEKLTWDDWALDPSVFNYSINWRPPDYVKGCLADSWEFTEPGTIVFHVRHGVHWQNIPPMNGRELIASDIVFHFNREYGLGGGYTTPSPYAALATKYKDVISVTADGNYTVIFKWKITNPEAILETLTAPTIEQAIEAPEAVQLWGNLNDWHHAIGTGPFILKDYVSGASATLTRNPNYWGYDERYPQNQLPYVNGINVLIIVDDATALSAMRTGKIDIVDQRTLAQAQAMQKTNPEILQTAAVSTNCQTIMIKNNAAPFTDIKVRKAMQMAINLPDIASSYYGGTVIPYPSSMTSYYEKGWGLPYDQWPQTLKDEYAYNPTAAKALLAAAGYPTIQTNVVADASGDQPLLQIVKSDFADVGITMDIRLMDAPSWNTYVRVQKKYDQLAYRSNGSLGFTYEPTTQLTQFQTGSSSNYLGISDPVFDAFYPKALAATNIDDIKQVVKDANLYVTQQHWLVSLLQPVGFAFCQPWIKGFTNQIGAVGNGSSGPFLVGFYCSRFWIDQNVKKSFSH